MCTKRCRIASFWAFVLSVKIYPFEQSQKNKVNQDTYRSSSDSPSGACPLDMGCMENDVMLDTLDDWKRVSMAFTTLKLGYHE